MHPQAVPGSKSHQRIMLRSSINIKGLEIPLIRANTIIVGAGAAGMNCTVQLVKFWKARGIETPSEKLLVVTGGLSLGASRMSGSDKQTYYKMGTSPRTPDTPEQFAKTLTTSGSCHADTALVEGTCSLRAFYHLLELGVPFPHDPFGSFVGYRTDNDPAERATSAGPRTSRFMCECLQSEAQRNAVEIIDGHVVVEFVTTGEGDSKRIVGMVCIDRSRAADDDFGLSVFAARNWVLAAGGPGEIYASTVYPPGQVGIHGPTFQAGLAGCNLTESQYGLGSVKFRWNISGTYMQAIPRIYSTDSDGTDQREFLTEYFNDVSTMATSIFLKGYQWPFDAQRIADQRSSLIDMAVHQETVVRGRKVWMDYLHNPIGADGWEEFDLGKIGPEALDYLKRTDALQGRPIDRLRCMNPPAIEIYLENGIDLTGEPLEIALCAQHHNGGFAVNKWWESNIPHTFVIGEMAGTHGVKRPGGAALNAGQVGALRAAEYIANVYDTEIPDIEKVLTHLAPGVGEVFNRISNMFSKDAAKSVTPTQAISEVRRRMTHCGAHLRETERAFAGLREAKEQYRSLLKDRMKVSSPQERIAGIQVLQQCLTHVAFLKAICGMFERSGGSRGSHCILDESGTEMHPRLIDPDTSQPYRLKSENEALRNTILCVRYNPQAEDLFDLWDVEPREMPDRQVAFELTWAQYRDGKIFEV